ncbi:WYL domain-containing protein [Sinosporangium album]|nr:WYL domain-containing protein [Sinosporangium album]
MPDLGRCPCFPHAQVEWVASRLGDTADKLEPIDSDTCRLSGQSDSLEWLVFRLVMLGCEFEVHGPPELVDYLREMAARTLRAVEDRN